MLTGRYFIAIYRFYQSEVTGLSFFSEIEGYLYAYAWKKKKNVLYRARYVLLFVILWNIYYIVFIDNSAI